MSFCAQACVVMFVRRSSVSRASPSQTAAVLLCGSARLQGFSQPFSHGCEQNPNNTASFVATRNLIFHESGDAGKKGKMAGKTIIFTCLKTVNFFQSKGAEAPHSQIRKTK